MGEQLGLQGLVIPEEFGGSGYSYVELIVVLEEMGRALLCAPFFSHRRARRQHPASTPATTPPRRSYLPGIASGETIATLAFTEPNGRWDESGIEATGHQATATAGRINGTKMFVLDGHTADLIIVAARTGAGVSLFAVDGDAAGPHPHRRCPRWTRPASRPSSSSPTSPATLIGTEGEGWDVLVDACSTSPPSALAAEQVGGAQKVPRDGGRVRQGPRAVRPPDRLVPGHQAQVRRHAARGRVGQVGRLLRRVVRRRAERRAARRWPRWPRPTARRRTSTPPPRTSRSTAASASPGSTRRTCTSSGPSRSELLFGDPTYHRELLAQRIGI